MQIYINKFEVTEPKREMMFSVHVSVLVGNILY